MFDWCSIGYVKEMHERVMGREVKVEALRSMLMDDPRCQFRIAVS